MSCDSWRKRSAIYISTMLRDVIVADCTVLHAHLQETVKNSNSSACDLRLQYAPSCQFLPASIFCVRSLRTILIVLHTRGQLTTCSCPTLRWQRRSKLHGSQLCFWYHIVVLVIDHCLQADFHITTRSGAASTACASTRGSLRVQMSTDNTRTLRTHRCRKTIDRGDSHACSGDLSCTHSQ